MLHLFLLSLQVAAPQSTIRAPQSVIAPMQSPTDNSGFYVVRSNDRSRWSYPSEFDSLKATTINHVVNIVGPWHNNRSVIYATLSSPTGEQVKAALAQAYKAWEREKAVSLQARPFLRSALPDDDDEIAGLRSKLASLFEGMTRYKRARFTQEIAVTNDRDRITPVPRTEIDAKWHQSGGTENMNVRSDLYKNDKAAGAEPFVDNISVLNSLGYYQQNRGWKRLYPDGSRFLDVLSLEGSVFEIRQREKVAGQWKSTVVFEDIKSRPASYKRFAVDCASCHDGFPGSGGYAAGLVSGSDGVFSDPFPALERSK